MVTVAAVEVRSGKIWGLAGVRNRCGPAGTGNLHPARLTRGGDEPSPGLSVVDSSIIMTCRYVASAAAEGA